MPAWLIGGSVPAREVLIDFSIDPTTIPSLSFVDVLAGRFDPATVAGKSVLIGASAIELGDWRSVPHYRALPGPLLQALVFETLIQDRALRRLDRATVILALGLLTLLAGPRFVGLPWRHGLVLLGGSSAVILVAAMVLQPMAALVVDTAAPLLGLVLAFSVAMLQRVERQAGALVGKIGALPAKDDMMRQLVDSSFDAIITFADGGTVLSCNRAAERIFGARAEAIIGGPIAALLPDDHGLSLEALAQAESSHELRGAHADGRYFPVEATFSRIRVDEKWLGIAILRDITERKAQQAELERLALHDALTAPAQPHPAQRPHRHGDQRRQARRDVDGGAAARPRPLQGRQRHSRASLRRPAADRGRSAAAAAAARGRHRGAAGRRRVRGAAAGPDRSRDRVQGGRAPGRFADPAVRHQRPGPRGRRQHRRRALSRPRPDRTRAPAARRRRDVRGQARPDRLRRLQPRDRHQQRAPAHAERTVAARDREWADGARVPAEGRRPYRRGGRRRGPDPLASSRARGRTARRVHPQRGADRPDQAAHALGDERGVERAATLEPSRLRVRRGGQSLGQVAAGSGAAGGGSRAASSPRASVPSA